MSATTSPTRRRIVAVWAVFAPPLPGSGMRADCEIARFKYNNRIGAETVANATAGAYILMLKVRE